MKILYHLPMSLMPINTGAKQRITGMLEYLKGYSKSLTVDIVGINPYGQMLWDENQLDFLRPYCRAIHIYDGSKQWTDLLYCKAKSFWHQKILRTQLPIDTDYYTPIGYQNFVSQLLATEHYDHIWINYLDSWALAMVKGASSSNKIIDIHDISCRIRLARKGIPHLKGLQFNYQENFGREVAALKQFNRVLVNSLTEMEELKPHFDVDKLMLVPHLLSGLPDKMQIPDYHYRSMQYDLLFVGAVYGPNVQGMQFFLNEVFPKIVEKLPLVKLAIVGNVRDGLEISDLVKKNVKCLGFVDNLSEIYLSSRVVICPLLDGSGTKVKLQEAMAYGVPIVTTSVGASGLAFEDGVNVSIHDSSSGFADSAVNLLQSLGMASLYSKNLLSTYESNYEKSVVYKQLDKVMNLSVRSTLPIPLEADSRV
jgi:glycosyltransferase involved in cell wall biosynthesis